MPRSIVVVGSVNLDLVCTGKRIPAPGETVTGDNFETFHGGKGANQAVAVGRLGFPVSMIAKVGQDEFGPRLRQGLQAAGVNVEAVAFAKRTPSGVALITVDGHGQNSITVIPGANAQLLPRDLEKSLPQLRAAGMILTQLETPMETVEYLCTLAGRFQVPLMLDPAPARALPRKMLRHVTYLTPNETETCALCGVSPSRFESEDRAQTRQNFTRQRSGKRDHQDGQARSVCGWTGQVAADGATIQSARRRFHRGRRCIQWRLGGCADERTRIGRCCAICWSRGGAVRNSGWSTTGHAHDARSEQIYRHPLQDEVGGLSKIKDARGTPRTEVNRQGRDYAVQIDDDDVPAGGVAVCRPATPGR